MNNVIFHNMALGNKKDVCIVEFVGNVYYGFAVVRNPNTETRTWSHAIQYCKSWEDAKNAFREYMGE